MPDGLNIEDDEPPPEPAPPEIPPRGHSLLQSTSTSARKCSDYQIHVRDVVLCADQKHEEFIPQEKQQGECDNDDNYVVQEWKVQLMGRRGVEMCHQMCLLMGH